MYATQLHVCNTALVSVVNLATCNRISFSVYIILMWCFGFAGTFSVLIYVYIRQVLFYNATRVS